MQGDQANGSEDFVVQEIPVVLRKSSANSHGRPSLLQFPLRPSWFKVDETDVVGAKVKPRQQLLCVELELPKTSPNIDEDAFTERTGRTCTAIPMLSSLVPAQATYCAASRQEGGLVITPINGIFSMRPNFEGMKLKEGSGSNTQDTVQSMEIDDRGTANPSADSLSKAASSSGLLIPSAVKSEREDDGVAIAGSSTHKRLTVNVARKETDRAKRLRQTSYTHLANIRQEEAWKPLSYKGYTSDSSKELLSNMFSLDPTAGESMQSIDARAFVHGNEEYNSMLQALSDIDMQSQVDSDGSLSRDEIESIDMSRRGAAIIGHTKCIPISRLFENANAHSVEDQSRVLNSALEVSRICKGCVVAHSSVIIPDDGGAAGADAMPGLRYMMDEIQLHLLDNQSIASANVLEMTKHMHIPFSKSKPFLESWLVWKGGSWSLPDSTFSVEVHTGRNGWIEGLLHQNEGSWANLRQNHATISRDALAQAILSSGMPSTSGGPMQSSSTGQSSGIPAALSHSVTRLLVELGPSSTSELLDSLQSNHNSVTESQLLEVLEVIAIQCRGFWVAKHTGSFDVLRTSIIECFNNQQGTIKRLDIANSMEAKGETIPAQHFSKVMKEFAVSRGTVWVFRRD